MSGESSFAGQPSTTALSSVAIQAGESRIIISVLKSGELIQLQLAEAIPNLLEIGASQEEAKKLLRDHNVLLFKLKSLEDQVWDILCQADETAEQNEDQRQIYDAMAATLKEAWDSLIVVLEKRRDLLHVTSEFFNTAAQFADAVDNAEAFLQNIQETSNSIPECLQQHQQHTRVVLERSLALLNKSQEVTEFIQQFSSQQPVSSSEMIKGARCSSSRIEDLLEVLQDRRRQLDKQMRQKRQRLEYGLQVSQWHQQEDKVMCWLRKHIDLYLANLQLGASLTENEELLHKHKQLVHNSTEWNSTVDNLKTEANRLSDEKDCGDIEKLNNSNQKLMAVYTEFWELMDRRQEILLEANDFFKCVNKAFDKLGGIESYLKHLRMQNLNDSEFSTKQKEAEVEIKRYTSDAFQKGHSLLKKSPLNPGMNGIQEMIGYLQKRVDQLTSQSPTSMESSLKQQGIMASLQDQLIKTSIWIQNIDFDLERHSNPGWSITECEEVRNKLGELARQTKEALQCMESAAQLMQMVPSGSEAFASNSQILDEKLKALDQSIEEKLEVISVYVTFLKSSKQLESHIENLKTLCTPNPEATTQLETAETQIQIVLDELFSVQDMGQNCLNIIKMMNKDRFLKDKHVQTVEDTIANLNKERNEITNLWSVWRQHVSQENSSKQTWRTIKDQLRLASGRLQELENDLQPLSSLSLGNDIQNILNAQEKLYNIKTKFQKLNDEMEQAIKISELLTREGTQINEKAGKINELAQYHQRLKDNIKEYEEIFIKIVTFYKMKTEINILKMEIEPLTAAHTNDDIPLNKKQEQQAHIQSLYKIILNLGSQIVSTIQHSKFITIPLIDLQQQLHNLERDSVMWNVEKKEEKASSTSNTASIGDVNELKESFKDLKKKFNNLKFNYTKKADKGRNLKVIKNQLQQVEMYAERIQALKKKIDHLENKIGAEVHKTDKMYEAICELQKHVSEFINLMQDYKVYLEMAEDLHHIMEESQFWCEEACATVVRVGQYSAECKTMEAVEALLKQFNKFVEPTLPQQEERTQQMINIAKHIYGAGDGMKYIEKTLVKHKEAINTVNDLCIYLSELEEKLQEPEKVPGISISEEHGEATEHPSFAKDGSILADAELHSDLLTEEVVSGDEYECISPDDISLPPLAETPESNLPQSETEQDEQNCYSSHNMHVSSYSLQMQINTSGTRLVDGSELLTPVAYTDVSSHRKENTSSNLERCSSPTIGYKTVSPFSHHSTVVNEARYSLSTSPAKAKPSYHLNEVHETHLQHRSVYESTEKTDQLHASDITATTKDRLHVTPDEFSGLMFQSDTAKTCQRHTVTQEAIKSVSEMHSNVIPAAQSPGFAKHLPNVTVKEGSPVTLEVEVTGYPEPTLTWYRKNMKYSTNDHGNNNGKQTSHTFIIQELCKKDSDQLIAQTSTYKAAVTSAVEAKIKGITQPILAVNWITLFVIYICVSVVYWMFS
ncbi:PREDICTED: coiled-coil domain-containing protein 141 [Nanorana parkeri]|uniref:coiled-coil domain-containing protein 141 n=1 Tax=Nanorana parkeri TaxID=125878 RepID=UPI0008541891|nr:PREDICTED: coiled-coil domain-containing protein 141 [Nanorana parkeri]